MNEEQTHTDLPAAPPVLVAVLKGRARVSSNRFTTTFTIGRSKECDVQVQEDVVSRRHLEVSYDGRQWWLKDLESANGTFVRGERITSVPLADPLEIELGKGGPVLSLKLEQPERPKSEETANGTREFTTETQIIKHYLDKSRTEEAGEQTMMFRRAFERVHKKKSKKFLVIIVVAVFLLVASGGVILYQKNKIQKLRSTAEGIFYTMKSLDLDIAKMEDIIRKQAGPGQLAEIRAKRNKLKDMEKDYDSMVKELGVYAKMSDKDRLIVKTARVLGECELTVPKGFTGEVKNYIGKWKSSERLASSINRAKEKGYAPFVAKTMARYELPPLFFYLALQESGFRADAVGPKTRYGYAKGAWQFLPGTAQQYGLKVGSRFKGPDYDPDDDRFNFEKATRAAARYIRDISNTEAQASGLLVMASYNWGENNTRKIIRRMPENPKERNFWRLLALKNIPKETYDYVFYIFSAAVVCEDPHLFGFDFDCPPTVSGK